MAADDGFRPLLADDDADSHSLPLKGDLSTALEADFSTSLVGSANPHSAAPVYLYVDDIPLSSEGARRFDNDATKAASAQWHCQDVKIAQVILLATSSVQILLGALLCVVGIGIFPLVSSVLGLVASVRYFVGDPSNLENDLKLAVFLGAIATPFNLVFDIVYLGLEIDTDFLAPILDVLACIFFGQAGAFLWIAVRAQRVKKNLLPNSSA